MDGQAVRDQVISLREEGKAYQFVDAGWRYLSAVPDDLQIAYSVALQLLDFGLAGPVRELLQSRQDLSSCSDKKEQLLSMVSSKPVGRISWMELKEQYAANLKLLMAKQQHLKGLEPELKRALDGAHLYQTADNHFLLSRKRAGCMREWLPFFTDYAVEREADLRTTDEATAVLLDGVTLGPLTDLLYEATADVSVNKSLALFFIEGDLANFAAWLHVADRSTILNDNRVFIFIGPEAVPMMERYLTGQDDVTLTITHIVSAPGIKFLRSEIQQAAKRVQGYHEDAIKQVQEQLKKRYAQRDLSYWETRLQQLGPVIGITSLGTTMLQYSTRDIGHALEEMGYDFHLLIETDKHTQLSILKVIRQLREVDPILIVLVDHLRYEYKDLPHNVPVLTWIQDPLPNLFCQKAGESIGDLDFVCGFFRLQCVEQYGYPRERFIDAVVPVSERVFHEGPVDESVRRRYQCDVMYVGHLSYTMESWREKWKSDNDEIIYPLLDRIFDEISTMLQRGEHLLTNQEELVKRICGELGFQIPGDLLTKLANFYAYRLFDIGYRHETLLWVGQWAQQTGRVFKLYGRGWEDHPSLSQYAKGPVEHGEQLRQAYRCARLVLQTIPSGFRHQRTLEAIASGSLVLSRHTLRDYCDLSKEEYHRQVESGEIAGGTPLVFPDFERIVFRDAQDFAKLARYYLEDGDAYRSAQREFQEIVMQKFTYKGVVSDIIKQVQSSIGQRTAP